ncbi:hypothetical protein BJX66DRAFT_345607 [Aspergillus keveii]|uniref:DUF7730 domain-containing protein n=1 Tax=Aspergillus keveii TaxID=714993 RepID=A0ABR4FHG5_9EURO
MPILARVQSESSLIHAQTQSRLLSLPYDLRVLIYEAVFAHNVIHLSTIRAEDAARTVMICHTWCIENWDARSNYAHVTCLKHPIRAGHLLGLPLTCRRVYLESIKSLYAKHTFSMNDDPTYTFLTFYWKTPTCHLNAVRSLRLRKTLVPPEQCLLHHKLYQVIKSRYIGAWEAIAGLPNLQYLFITSEYEIYESREDPMQDAEFINPIKVVQQRGLKHFDVVLHFWRKFFPQNIQDTLDDQKLHWECFEIKEAGADGTRGLC